jgi:hypothetical protein
MPSSTRLDKETEAVLQKSAAILGVTKSQLVRESIREHCKKILKENKKTPWEIYQYIHKPGGSGHGKRVSLSRDTLIKKLKSERKKWSS